VCIIHAHKVYILELKVLVKGDNFMAGSSFGKNITVTTWGESHGKALGVVIDGFPAGMELVEDDIQKFLDRRKPGTSNITTPRKEDDKVEILSGVFEGKTTGSPISLMVKNTSQISKDYSEIASYYRPGHADYTFDEKYGFRDYRGGGRSSGRETLSRVAAGALCAKLLGQMGIDICAYTKSIADIECDDKNFNRENIYKTATCMPDEKANELALSYISKMREEEDSVGGVIECKISGMPKGIGQPVFDKLDANLAKALMSIGAVKAVEIGDGIQVSKMLGSMDNDGFEMNGDNIIKTTNHAGGILGGMSDGSDIVIRVHIKPTPSISKEQNTVNKKGENIKVNIKGRHDPVIVPRAVVVAESMCAITLLDMMISNMSSKAQSIINFYSEQ